MLSSYYPQRSNSSFEHLSSLSVPAGVSLTELVHLKVVAPNHFKQSDKDKEKNVKFT